MILFLILDGLSISFFSAEMKVLTHKLDTHKPRTHTHTQSSPVPVEHSVHMVTFRRVYTQGVDRGSCMQVKISKEACALWDN